MAAHFRDQGDVERSGVDIAGVRVGHHYDSRTTAAPSVHAGLQPICVKLATLIDATTTLPVGLGPQLAC
jgi:hypothetical protein